MPEMAGQGLENLVGTTSGVAQNEIVPVSLQVDQLLNDIGGTGELDKSTVEENINSRFRGKKGKSFRGGSKSVRDNWYGYSDKNFQDWWHRVGKNEWGGGDIQDS